MLKKVTERCLKMFMNERRIDIILKGSLLIMWIHCAIWIATVSSSPVATNGSADSISYKTVSLTQAQALAASSSSSSKSASNTNANKTSSPKPPTTKSFRFLDDFGELPGVQKEEDDYATFINETAKTTTVRIPTQEKRGAVNDLLSAARPSVNGNRSQVGEAGDVNVASKTSNVSKKSLPSETESVNRTSASSNPGKNSTTKTGKAQQVPAAAAAAEINSTKLPAARDFKFSVPNDENDNKASFSTATKTASAKAPVHQRVEVNTSSSGAYPSVEDKQKPTVRNGNGTAANTVLGASKTKDSHAAAVNTSKTFSTAPNVSGNGTNPLKKVTVITSKLKTNVTSKTNKSNITSTASKDRRDNASDVKTSSNRNVTVAKNHTATKHSVKDTSLKSDVSNSTYVMVNDSRKITANIQSSKPSVAASSVTNIGNITSTRNQASKTLKFKSVLEIGKSNIKNDISKDKASDSGNLKHKIQPAPTSNIADAGNTTKANNRTSEIINVNGTLKADKSVATSNVTKDKTKNNKTPKITSNITGTNDTNKAKNKISASLTSKNTPNLEKSNPLSIASKGKESNVGKLSNKLPANTTANGNTTKTKNQTSASLTLISVLKIGMSNFTTGVTGNKGNNAVNMKNRKQPATTSNVSATGSSNKTINRTSATSNIKDTLKSNKSNTPSNIAKEKTVDSLKGNKPSAKTSNTTKTSNTSKTNDHNSVTESIKATLKTGRPKLNATFNTLKDKENNFGNIKNMQSVVSLNKTATGNITKTNNQTTTILVFKSILKIAKSNTTSDLTNDKRKTLLAM